MSFEHRKKSVTIRGMNSNKSELVEGVQICQLTTIEGKGMLLQIVQQEQVNNEEKPNSSIESVLNKYTRIFEEPKGLPPIKSHDHKINLKEGTLFVSVRPVFNLKEGCHL